VGGAEARGRPGRRRERGQGALPRVVAPGGGEPRRGLAHLRRVTEEARGDPAGVGVPPDGARSGVVRHERELDVAERVHEPAEVAHAGAHVRDRVERVGGGEARAPRLFTHRRVDQLHEPDRAGRRHGAGVEAGLDPENGQDEERIERAGLLEHRPRDAGPLGLR